MREDGTEESQEDSFECHPRKGDQEPWQVFKEGLNHAIIYICFTSLTGVMMKTKKKHLRKKGLCKLEIGITGIFLFYLGDDYWLPGAA